MTNLPRVSIAVTTKNSSRTLAACLESIRLQDYPNIQLIVVDNFSEDGTFELAKEFTSDVYLGGPERSAQRNKALREIASGEILGYFDSDMVLGPLVVSHAVNLMKQGSVAVFVEERIMATGIYGKVRNFERSAYTGTDVDAVRFFCRDDFVRVGGFDEGLPPGPEDWDLSLRLGECGHVGTVSSVQFPQEAGPWPLHGICRSKGHVPLSATAVYHDESSSSFLGTLVKKQYYVDGIEAYKAKWGSQNRSIYRQLSPKFRLWSVFFSRDRRGDSLRNFHFYLLFLVWKAALGALIATRSLRNSVRRRVRKKASAVEHLR